MNNLFYKNTGSFTCYEASAANLLAAQKINFSVAGPIVPLAI